MFVMAESTVYLDWVVGSVCFKCSVSEDRKMRLLVYIVILFTIPNVLLSCMITRKYFNQNKISVSYYITAVRYVLRINCEFLRLAWNAVMVIRDFRIKHVFRFVIHPVIMESVFDQTYVSVWKVFSIRTMILRGILYTEKVLIS